MTPQAVRRKDVYHVNSIESSWIVSEISLFQVKDIIQGAIWIDGGWVYIHIDGAITMCNKLPVGQSVM